MRLQILILTLLVALPVVASESTRKERNFITAGNALYSKGKYYDAQKEYEKALDLNPSSAVARYNLGLSQIRLSAKDDATEEETKKIKDAAVQNMQAIAQLGASKPGLAGKANYNLGNLAFNSDDYQGAINFYKQALRLNPADDAARRNLRIAQKKIQNQDKKDQNQDQDKDQNQQDNKQDQQDNKQEQQDDKQNQQNQQQNQQQQQERMNPQAAEQILKAIENKENNTRARVANPGKSTQAQGKRSRKNW